MTPRLPRGISGQQLAEALSAFGYQVNRRSGSHMRLTTSISGEHHITIPTHDSLRIGTLAGILGEVARHLGLSKSELLDRLFG